MRKNEGKLLPKLSREDTFSTIFYVAGLLRFVLRFFLQKLSGWRAYSDSGTRFSSRVVRIRAAFGLRNPLILGSCPNTGLIRTPESAFLRELSEYRTYSDLGTRFSSQAVRIRVAFGLGAPLFFASCPITGGIRTPGPAFLRRLSEYRYHSDSRPSFPSQAVRIQAPYFVQAIPLTSLTFYNVNLL
jgi:hypothetical protein